MQPFISQSLNRTWFLLKLSEEDMPWYKLKNKNTINVLCIKHPESEDVEKSKYNHHNEGQKTNYKIKLSCKNGVKILSTCLSIGIT